MRLAPRWSKALGDIQARPGRSLLVVLAMAAGIFELLAMLYAYAALSPALGGMYARTRPASATLQSERLSDALVDSVRRVAGVADAELRPVGLVRVRAGSNDWVPGLVSALRAPLAQRLDLVVHEQGAWPPRADEILLERSALQVAHARIGDHLTLRTPDGTERSLRIAGTVHAAGLPPAWMEHMVPVFVGWDSPLRAAATTEQLRIVADRPLEEGRIHQVADSVQALLERRGHAVARVAIPPPGRHPHAAQMAAFLYLLGAFGAVSFVLGAVLAASMVQAIMAEQVREVGILKALGATTAQVAGIHLAQVGLLAGAALALGIPAGIVAGRAYVQFAAAMLNADVAHQAFPWAPVLAALAIGAVAPLLVALVPVITAARMTVREALAGTSSAQMFGAHPLERALLRLRSIPRPLVLSLRGTLAQRGRLALAVTMLALGGGAFIAALDVAEGWNEAVRRDFACRRYDLSVQLVTAAPIAAIDRALRGVRGVVRTEYWAGGSAYLLDSTGVPTAPVALAGPEPTSGLLALPLLAGRWLTAGDSAVAVLNQAALKGQPWLARGGRVRVRNGARDAALRIVGIVRELSPMPVVYAPRAAVLAVTGATGDSARLVRIVTRNASEAGEAATARDVEAALAAAGLEVQVLQRMSDARRGILDHLVIIQSFLPFASLVVVLVGALALTSTLSLGVVQRTREIGILGAIGARPRTIASHVVIESLLIAIASALLAQALAAPLAWLLETTTGRIFFGLPLDFHMGALPSALWLGLVLMLAAVSSIYPAWRATRLTVREALVHA